MSLPSTQALPQPQQPDEAPARLLEDLWLSRQTAGTAKVYARALRDFRAWYDRSSPDDLFEWRTVRLDTLERFQASLSHLSPATQVTTMSALRSLMTFLEACGYLTVNVGRALKLPDRTPDLSRSIPERDDVIAMVEAEPNRRNRLALRLTYGAGLRAQELCRIRVGDIRARPDLVDQGQEPAGQALIHGKGGKQRVVLLPPALWADLQAWIAAEGLTDRDALLPGRGRTAEGLRLPMNPVTAWRIVTTAAKRVGLKVNTHALRHAHATDALDMGAGLKTVQQSLGHGSLATTTIYAHRRPKEGTGLTVAF